MTKYKAVLMILAGPAWCAGYAVATPTVQPITAQEAAYHGGATHVVELDHDDFSETTTNTAETVALFSVAANTGVQFVYSQLITAFQDTTDTNHTQSALTIGDGTDVDLFMASQELNANGTEVWVQFSRANGGTVAITPQTTSLTYGTNVTYATTNLVYLNASTNATTNAVATSAALQTTSSTVATNVTALFTAAALGEKLYTAADTVDAVLTPNSADATASLNAGRVRLYFRLFKRNH